MLGDSVFKDRVILGRYLRPRFARVVWRFVLFNLPYFVELSAVPSLIKIPYTWSDVEGAIFLHQREFTSGQVAMPSRLVDSTYDRLVMTSMGIV